MKKVLIVNRGERALELTHCPIRNPASGFNSGGADVFKYTDKIGPN